MQVTQGRSSAASPVATAHVESACALLRSGQVLIAQDRLTQLVELAEQRSDTFTDDDRATLLAALVDCRLARGQLADADSLREQLVPLASIGGVAGAIATFATAELTAVVGDPDRAITLYLAAGERAHGHPVPPEVAPWRAGAVLTMVRTGRRDAGELAVEHHKESLRAGSPYAVSLALRTLATADANGRRLSLLRDAREALSGIVADRLAAQIDTDIAGLLLLSPSAAGESEALALLRDAELYSGQQELWPLQSRVRRLLDRLGHAPLPAHNEALSALTQAELRVAGLAVDGLTNRQIAEHLVVSVKAVEWHLSRVYRKLGIRSRQSLAPTLGIAV